MSRIGKKVIEIPSEVEVAINRNSISVKGPKGELNADIRPEISVEINNSEIKTFPKKETNRTKAFWGLTRTLISNMIVGVTSGYEVKLKIEGVGYRANLEGDSLVFQLGFSHPVKINPPKGVVFNIERNIVSVSGIDKQLVSQTAANIRKIKPPEPYKGKGIRYENEIVKRKVGKKVIGSGS